MLSHIFYNFDFSFQCGLSAGKNGYDVIRPDVKHFLPSRRTLTRRLFTYVDENMPYFLLFMHIMAVKNGAAISMDTTTKKHVYSSINIHFIDENDW